MAEGEAGERRSLANRCLTPIPVRGSPRPSGEYQRQGKQIDMTEDISRRAYIEEAPPIIGEIAELVIQGAPYRGKAMDVLKQAARSLRNLAKAHDLSAEYENVEIQQTRGPTIRFAGQLLAEAQFRTGGRAPMNMDLAIYETAGGAYIALSEASPIDGGGFVDSRATVVEPGADEMARRFAVMDHFDWHDRARSMVGKKLGWKLSMEVD